MENRVLQAQKTRHQREHLRTKSNNRKEKVKPKGKKEEANKHTKINQERKKKEKKSLTNTAENRTPEERPEREEEAATSSGRRQGIGTTGVVAKRDKAKEEKKRATNKVPLSIPWAPLAPSPQAHLPGFLEPAACNVFHFT
jgi:hypothetical protein